MGRNREGRLLANKIVRARKRMKELRQQYLLLDVKMTHWKQQLVEHDMRLVISDKKTTKVQDD